MESIFLHSALREFRYYKTLGDKAMAQIDEQALFIEPDPMSNSIAMIVKHMWGNMLSRWTDFLHSDGEKEWRNRDSEFINDIQNRSELLEKWEQGWNLLFSTLEALTEQDLLRIVKIRGEDHTVIAAINRQIAHYAYHTGQIVYLARMLNNGRWQSLSIPRGESAAFNRAKMGQ
jgi:uncharacterized damage-inducible protein DinB